MSNKNKAKEAKAAAPKEVSLEAELGLEETITEEVVEETVEEVVEETVEQEPEFEEGDFVEATETETVEPVVEAPVEEVQEAKEKKRIGEVVRSDEGAPLFKRMAPTREDNGSKRKERMKPSYKPRDKQVAHAVSANAALLNFPNDRYGITKDIKKAMTSAASRIAGDATKKELVLEVVGVLLEHIEAKYVADRAYREALAARED